ncbi:MAG TPA: hypothetical protein VMR33_13915 [Candidatus Baltobacteraceae bacterium]|jgi:hypothetical protein|nr:hypothetical protein [Candidatus Baltobacteraceae bacterium]
MRTKTMLLSALLGTLGSVSLMAQSTNVYSLNAVGYINVTIEPGYNIISCPLIASPDNTLNTLLSPTNGEFKGFKFYPWSASAGTYGSSDTATAHAWAGGGTETLLPGQAGFIFNPGTSNVTATFVGTVPSGSLTNTLLPGFNLVSSILPTSGDIVTNTLTDFTTQKVGDKAYSYDPVAGYTTYSVKPNGSWAVDPVQANVGGGFFYFSATATNDWVENFSVGQ